MNRDLRSCCDRLHRASESLGAHRVGKLAGGTIVWFHCEFSQEDSYLELMYGDGRRIRAEHADLETQREVVSLSEKRMQRALVA